MQIVAEKIDRPDPGEPIYNENADIAMFVIRGSGEVRMGKQRSNMSVRQAVSAGSEIVIPQNSYYEITSSKNTPIYVVSHYSPKVYPFGFVE